MKITFKYTLLAAAIVMLFGSCRNDDIYPQPDPEWAPVVTAEWTDMSRTFYNATDLDNSVFEYVLDGEDFDKPMAEVASIEVFLEYNGQGRVAFGVYDNLPATISLSASEAAQFFGLSTVDLEVGDKFTFSYIVNAKDGRTFTLYNNNICNLIRVIGICHLDAFVLSPAVVKAETELANISLSDIGSGSAEFSFGLVGRKFTNADVQNVDLELTYENGTSMDYEWKTAKSFPFDNLPGSVSISVSEAMDLFGLQSKDLEPGDKFTGRFVYYTPSGSCTTYGSGICGADFPSYIVFPQHRDVTGEIPDLGFLNPQGTATAPPATSLSGTCSMEINITE